MFRRILMVIAVISLIVGMSKISFAMMCGSHSQHQDIAQAGHSEHQEAAQEAVTQAAPKEAVNAGNKVCPVSGEEIDEKMKSTYEYEGKVYNFCCEMCIEDFKKDPQKYINKVKEELKSESSQKTQEESVPEGMHEGHHH